MMAKGKFKLFEKSGYDKEKKGMSEKSMKDKMGDTKSMKTMMKKMHKGKK